MKNVALSIPEQIKVALDGRTQRWLSFEIRMPEPDLSKKMQDKASFTDDEIKSIEERLNFKIAK